jgi:UDP-N-acetylmuramoyl-L-alanyl-D-glutamate--2,6-diaminopimelate ligase
MQFSQLLELAGLDVAPRGDAPVGDVQFDSRRCGAGSCFVAVRGWTDDGHKYIDAALAGGASAIVCSDASAVPEGVACAVVEDGQRALGLLAQAIEGNPARKLTCIGITGTNGKTTTAHLLRDMLERAGMPAGMLGTISYDTGRRTLDASATTPDPVSLAGLCGEMVAAGKTHLVMEVSSHALHQRRTAGLEFSIGVFTNLTGDHLDYHRTMDDYLAAKRLLFEQLSADGAAIINADDPAAVAIAAGSVAPVTTYGLGADADLRAQVLKSDASGTAFELSCGGKRLAVETPMIGLHNVSNCLAAVGACVAAGVELARAAQMLRAAPAVPGRLQRAPGGDGFEVFVDYAHTDDALRNVLSALRPVTRGRLIVVFGCGGDRDRTKRPRMAAAAGDLADVLVITSDNPRSEEPKAIVDDIVAGLDDGARRRAIVHVDRRLAIAAAVGEAREGDVVLIAGKGHETYQTIKGQNFHFDDVEVAAEAMASRGERV